MTKTTDSSRICLRDGGDWADHEDCIIGNEPGLRSLIKACEEALENGEYYGTDLDDYVGVKLLSDNWFEKPHDSLSTNVGTFTVALILVGVLALIAVGGYTVFSWL